MGEPKEGTGVISWLQQVANAVNEGTADEKPGDTKDLLECVLRAIDENEPAAKFLHQVEDFDKVKVELDCVLEVSDEILTLDVPWKDHKYPYTTVRLSEKVYETNTARCKFLSFFFEPPFLRQPTRNLHWAFEADGLGTKGADGEIQLKLKDKFQKTPPNVAHLDDEGVRELGEAAEEIARQFVKINGFEGAIMIAVTDLPFCTQVSISVPRDDRFQPVEKQFSIHHSEKLSRPSPSSQRRLSKKYLRKPKRNKSLKLNRRKRRRVRTDEKTGH